MSHKRKPSYTPLQTAHSWVDNKERIEKLFGQKLKNEKLHASHLKKKPTSVQRGNPRKRFSNLPDVVVVPNDRQDEWAVLEELLWEQDCRYSSGQ